MWLILSAGTLNGEEPVAFEKLSAREAVHRGNRLLAQGDASAALKAYEYAGNLRPDASEIPFLEGLGYYKLKQYHAAREAFEKAALSKNHRLADDAVYSIGTTHHAEAMEASADPKVAIEKLENAIERYQDVLANQPDHPETRDAIVKAASMRRRLRQMLQQKQRQQQQNQDQDHKNGERNSEDQHKPKRQDRKEQGKPAQSDAQEESGAESGGQQDQQQVAQQQEQRGDEERQQAQQAGREEQDSRDQARRRLREIMQNLRERQKRRREAPQPFLVEPVDKDW